MKKEILRLEHIYKKTQGDKLLYNINLNLLEGEILGVIVRSSSERNALLNILTGSSQNDSGFIYVDDVETNITSKLNAKNLGIYCVYKKNELIPSISIAENIFVIREGSYLKGYINKKLIETETQDILNKSGLNNISSSMLCNNLNLAKIHTIEIIKATSLNAKILIIDNITGQYSQKEIENLKKLLLRKKLTGLSIIFLTNKYSNLLDIADRVTVMRNGTTVSTLYKEQVTKETIISLLAGYRVNDILVTPRRKIGDVVLSLEHISTKLGLHDISITLRKGEVLGLFESDWEYGVTLANAMFGTTRYTGNIIIDGKNVIINSTKKAINNGIGLIKENDKSNGIFYNMSLMDNVTIMMNKRLYHLCGFENKRIKSYTFKRTLQLLHCSHLISDIGDTDRLPHLSKSTQMKIMMAKWLCTNPKVLILINPYLSFDDLTINDFKQLIDDICNIGVSIIIISSNMSNLLQVSDRIVVLEDGRLIKEITNVTNCISEEYQ